MNSSTNLKLFIRTAMLTALAAVLTMFPQIPTGTGYVHFGDSIIYLASIFLGPLPGAAVGAIGHGLADLLSGYPIYVLPTFCIKGLIGFAVGEIAYKNHDALHFSLAALAALVIVTLGYFLVEIPMYGIGSAVHVFISSPVQWLMSIAASAVLIPILKQILKKFK